MIPCVGAGKTMLMDLFYDKVNVPVKQRIHFNAFMQDVHERGWFVCGAVHINVIGTECMHTVRAHKTSTVHTAHRHLYT